ncbi:MAG: SRPBCC family protein [Pirellulaceae bacterium]
MHLEDTIDIEVPPDRVWQASIDLENWPQWNPNVRRIQRLDSGPLRVGSAARIVQPGIHAEWVVTELTPGHRFQWETRFRGMHLMATHEVSAASHGTRNLLRLAVTGWLGRLYWPLLRRLTERALRQENEGLKRFCELSTEK